MSVEWDTEQLHQIPRTYPAGGFRSEGIETLFYDGLSWRGKPTRAFAWLGMPDLEEGERCPGIVLVHGGGGTAFDSWVRLWNERGYAAISMDLCGCVPEPQPIPPGGERARHERGGPPGWGGFDQIDESVEDQWTYQAVGAIGLGHSLLAAQPQVDAERIGITGISWGGYLTCIAAGVDARFRFAVSVYGCGFLGENSAWKQDVLAQMGEDRRERWLAQWDPAVYLPRAEMPFCWVTGTNDFAYPLDSLQKSHRLTAGEKTACIRVEMPHGHGGAGENPEEIRVFADSHLQDGEPLARVTGLECENGRIRATFESARPIVRAELNFTRAEGFWPDRKYNILPATVEDGCVEAEVPPMATVCFLNLFDDRDCAVSTEFVEP
jgi:dienelactone hydrolase